jgi:tetratricopeptide (TPR) repeat protein
VCAKVTSGWPSSAGDGIQDGISGMPRYLLAHLPIHMARAERWEELGTLLNDGEFLGALEGSAYARWHRFESAEWQEILSAWARHLLSRQGSEKARRAIATVYFNAFWWWGEYISFPLCEQISTLVSEACRGSTQDRFLNALRQFDQAYPRKRDYSQRRTAVENWQQTKEALEILRSSLGCAGDLAGLQDDPRLLHLRAITNTYLAEACHALGEPGAEAYYEEACAIVQEIDDDRWITSWIFYQLGELWTERGQEQVALSQCWKALTTADETDHEVRANTFRVLGDVLWNRGQHDRALASYQLALYYAFRFQADPHPADLYTITFYGEMMERVLERIRGLEETGPAAAAELCRPLHDFWSCYWAQGAGDEGRLDEATLETWLKRNREAELKAYFFPPAPTSGDREYARMVQEVSEQMAEQIGLLEKSLAAVCREPALPAR